MLKYSLIIYILINIAICNGHAYQSSILKPTEKYIAIQLGQKEGLIPTYLNDIVTDTAGKLVLGTFGSGIITYNGIEFLKINSENLSKFPIIENLKIKNGEYYFRTSSELYVWNPITDEISKIYSGDSPIIYYELIENNKILISTAFETVKLERQNKIYIQNEIFYNSPIIQMLVLKSGKTLKISLNGEITTGPFGKNRNVLFKFDEYESLRLFESENHILLIKDDTIFYLDKIDYSIKISIKIPGKLAPKVFLNSEKELWMAIGNQVYLLRKEKLKKINLFEEKAEIDVSSITSTNDGTIWFGTYGQGLYKLYDTEIIQYETKGNDLKQINSIFSISNDNDQHIITTNNSIIIYDGTFFEKLTLPTTNQQDFLYSSVDKKTGDLFIGGDGFILVRKLDDKIFKGYYNEIFTKNPVMNITPFKENYLIGTKKGLYLFDEEFKLIKDFNKDSKIKTNDVFKIFVINETKIIYGNNFSLYATNLRLTTELYLPEISGKILSIVPHLNNQYFLGTTFGKIYLYDFNRKTIIKELTSKGGKNIYSISIDAYENLVIGTETGIEKHFTDGTYLLFDERLSRYEINYNSISNMNNGDILIGTTNGLFKISSQYKYKERIKTDFEHLVINNKVIPIEEILRENKPMILAHTENNLKFKVEIINYQNLRNLEIEYKLDGYDTEWSANLGNAYANYTNLPPGTYRINAKVQYGQGDFQIVTIPFEIIIDPPLWQHPFSIFIILSSTIVIIYFGFIWFERKNLRNNIKLQNLVTQRTEEINQINRGLERQVYQRTIDLEKKNKELAKTVDENLLFQTHVQLISSNTGDIVCLISSDRKINLISKSVEVMLGIQPEDLINNPISLIIPDIYITELFNSLNENKKQHETITLNLSNKKTNEIVLIEIIAKKILNKKTGSPKGLVLNLRDITERELLKNELNSVYKNIHRDFHDEVGNKLAKIIAQISVLKIQMKEFSSIGETVDRIENTAKHLYHDTRDFIWSLDQDNNNLEELCFQVRDFGERLFEGSSITFKCDLEITENLNIKPNLVRDILLIMKEIMTNVLKHSKATEAHLKIKQKGTTILFYVKDDGIGISPTKEEKGNGLKNILFRISRCNGELIIKNKKGTLIGLRKHF